jgi:cytochrome c oxidase subunit III
MTADASALTHADTHPELHAPQRGGIGNPVLGMLLFIASEVMFFAGLFAAYFSIRAGYTELDKATGLVAHTWPPGQFKELLNPFTLTTHNGALNLILPATLVLVLSSVTCQLGVNAIKRGDRTGFLRNFSITLTMGVVFLLLQAFDYSVLISEGLSMGSTTFGTTYFTLTGFHGAHVFGGALMLGVVVYRGMAGQFSARHHDMVEAASWYWHFVDVVWVLLFSILYLL